jgi:hypothetical protein
MTHLTWPNLMPVALRIRVANAVLASKIPLEVFHTDPEAAKVFDRFHSLSHSLAFDLELKHRSEDEADEEGAALDKYYARVGEALRQAGRSAAKSSKLAEQALNIIANGCNHLACGQCNGEAPCRWTKASGSADQKVLSSRGHCIAYVRDTFDWATAQVEARYAEHGVGRKRDSVSLTTGHIKSRDATVKLGSTANTTQNSSAGDVRAVFVGFHPRTVWIPDLLTLPYLLMHECVAHAWCGIDILGKGCEQSKPFHEGWMDCAAFEILEQALSVAGKPDHLEQNSAAMLQQTSDVRLIRFYPYGANFLGPGYKESWKWRKGFLAFDSMTWLFARVLVEIAEDDNEEWVVRAPTSEEFKLARQRVTNLSLQINASDLTHSEREQFVSNVVRFYGKREEADRAAVIDQRIDDLPVIAEYLRTGDHKQFVGRIRTLK